MKHHLQYLKYLLRHKWYVLVAGDQLGVNWWQLIIHDWQKLLPIEWFGYVKAFYPTKKGRAYHWKDERFQHAWNHHQKHCRHHWQYWILVEEYKPTTTLRMPDKYIKEMVSDWFGAGKAITGKWEADQWYEKNKNEILLHPETRKKVENLIDILEKRVKLLS